MELLDNVENIFEQAIQLVNNYDTDVLFNEYGTFYFELCTNIDILLNELDKKILNWYKQEKINKLLNVVFPNSLLKELITIDMAILNAEIKTINYLKFKKNILYDYTDKNDAITYLNLFKDLVKLELMRNEFIKMNSNTGRTILCSLYLDDMKNIINQISNYLDVYRNCENDKRRKLSKENG